MSTLEKQIQQIFQVPPQPQPKKCGLKEMALHGEFAVAEVNCIPATAQPVKWADPYLIGKGNRTGSDHILGTKTGEGQSKSFVGQIYKDGEITYISSEMISTIYCPDLNIHGFGEIPAGKYAIAPGVQIVDHQKTISERLKD